MSSSQNWLCYRTTGLHWSSKGSQSQPSTTGPCLRELRKSVCKSLRHWKIQAKLEEEPICLLLGANLRATPEHMNGLLRSHWKAWSTYTPQLFCLQRAKINFVALEYMCINIFAKWWSASQRYHKQFVILRLLWALPLCGKTNYYNNLGKAGQGVAAV